MEAGFFFCGIFVVFFGILCAEHLPKQPVLVGLLVSLPALVK